MTKITCGEWVLFTSPTPRNTPGRVRVTLRHVPTGSDKMDCSMQAKAATQRELEDTLRGTLAAVAEVHPSENYECWPKDLQAKMPVMMALEIQLYEAAKAAASKALVTEIPVRGTGRAVKLTPPKTPADAKTCGCGCGEAVKGMFRPGHDSKLLSALLGQVRSGQSTPAQATEAAENLGCSPKFVAKLASKIA